MVDLLNFGIGLTAVPLSCLLGYHFYQKYQTAKEKTKYMKSIQEGSKVLELQTGMNKQQAMLEGLLPHYIEEPKIESLLPGIRKEGDYKVGVSGENFVVVHRSSNHWTGVRTQLQKTKISSKVLVERKINGKKTDTETLSRAKQLAVLGALGYDIVNREFYIEAEMVGESIHDILAFFQAKQITEVIKIALCVCLGVAGLLFIWQAFPQRRRR